MKFLTVAAATLLAASTSMVRADDARFDLLGPKIDVRVTRGSVTLPISQVPNLQPGDKIWLKADLPSSQSNHLLLIVAFLRGTTNVPPENWFTEIDTWNKKSVEGNTVTVPAEAEQALLFVAPETGGDFKTLRSAVRGKPGLFIRADADLNEASFEQQRIEHYLAAMRTVSQDDPKAIKDHSAKLASTLDLKPDAKCFDQAVDQQVTCLTQASAPVLLSDGHGQSIAEALTTGASSDFINAASTTQAAGAGLYSAYVGTVIDLVHLASTLRTAQYQYIPGLSFPQGSTLNLRLNAPVSFNNPKSVIVIGLPAIQKAKLPPLHPHDPNQVGCLLKPQMSLPLEGAPLVFSTSFAHDLVLRLNRAGSPTDIPLRPDAFEGGLVVAKEDPRKPLPEGTSQTSSPAATRSATSNAAARGGTEHDLTITGTVRGFWGFDSFEGPTLTLQQTPGRNWKIVGDTQLLAGRDNHLTLKADGTACVEHIALTNDKHSDLDVAFKLPESDAGKDLNTALDLSVPLKKVQPGGYSLAIQQFGAPKHDLVALTAYSSDIDIDDVRIHAGDSATTLTGKGLENVTSVQIGDQTFTPTGDSDDGKTLQLSAKSGVSPQNGSDATVHLKDGRTLTVNIAAEAPRPGLKLLSFNATPLVPDGAIPVSLGAKDEIPLNGRLTFVVQTVSLFPRTQTVEVATADGGVHTSLSLAGNNLILQDEHTAVATLDPLKAFGQSAFGKLQMRPVAADGTSGNWTALGTLVRTPGITAIECPPANATSCTVRGSNFFLVQSFSADKDFSKAVEVPTGYADDSFTVPAPADGATLYLKLRDDPSAAAALKLPKPITPAAPPAAISAAPAPATKAVAPTSVPVLPAQDPAGTAGVPPTSTAPGSATLPQPSEQQPAAR